MWSDVGQPVASKQLQETQCRRLTHLYMAAPHFLGLVRNPHMLRTVDASLAMACLIASSFADFLATSFKSKPGLFCLRTGIVSWLTVQLATRVSPH